MWPYGFDGRICGNEHIITINDEHFGEPWKGFTVEVLGLAFKKKILLPQFFPYPLFHKVSTSSYPQRHMQGTDYYEEEHILEKCAVYVACRIKHDNTGLVVKLHAWESHDILFTVDNFNFQASSSFAVLKQALSFFSLGSGRPTEHFSNSLEFTKALRVAIIRLSQITPSPTEAEVAAEICPEDSFNERVLRRWLKKTNWVNFRWPELIKAVIEDEERGYHRPAIVDEISPLSRFGLKRRSKRT